MLMALRLSGLLYVDLPLTVVSSHSLHSLEWYNERLCITYLFHDHRARAFSLQLLTLLMVLNPAAVVLECAERSLNHSALHLTGFSWQEVTVHKRTVIDSRQWSYSTLSKINASYFASKGCVV